MTFLYRFAFAGVLLLTPSAVASEAPARGPESVAEVIDCQLPPKVRKFGAGNIQQVPGAILRVTLDECRSRGGAPLGLRQAAAR